MSSFTTRQRRNLSFPTVLLVVIDAGLLEQGEAWVATQDICTQAAYADSGTFLHTDEMLQQGFPGLAFTKAQIDQFFTEASAL